MKKIPVIILIVLAIFIGCEKEKDESCWKCYLYFYEEIYVNGIKYRHQTIDSIELCGYSDSDIEKYEKFRTLAPYYPSMCDKTRIRWQDCLCIKNNN